MKKLFLSLTVIGSIFLTSCGGSDAVTATEAQETAEATAEAVEYAVNTNVSTTTWRGFKVFQDTTKPESGHYGIVKMKEGSVTVKNGLLESGNFVADMNTFESEDLNEDLDTKAKLDGHLKAADFLDVAQYPTSTFVVTSATKLESGDYNTEISGNLDFRGAPKNITFKANVNEADGKVTIKSEEFKINRQDFGITYKGGGDSVIKDDVILQLDVTADKK